MKTFKILQVILCLGFVSTVQGQENQSSKLIENTVKTEITPVNTFKLPYSVEVFSSNERDERNRVIVRGWDVKGKIVAGAVSSVGNLAGGAGGGAAAASYAATGRVSNARIKVTVSQKETGDEASTFTDEEGNFSLTLKHDTLHTIYVNDVEYGHIKLKTKHDTAKNSVGNIR